PAGGGGGSPRRVEDGAQLGRVVEVGAHPLRQVALAAAALAGVREPEHLGELRVLHHEVEGVVAPGAVAALALDAGEETTGTGGVATGALRVGAAVGGQGLEPARVRRGLPLAVGGLVARPAA